MKRSAIIILATVAACATAPDFERPISDAARSAPYPQLQPLGQLLAQADAQTENASITPATTLDIQRRIASLRSRAARLRRPVIEPSVRARMRRGVAVPAAIR